MPQVIRVRTGDAVPPNSKYLMTRVGFVRHEQATIGENGRRFSAGSDEEVPYHYFLVHTPNEQRPNLGRNRRAPEGVSVAGGFSPRLTLHNEAALRAEENTTFVTTYSHEGAEVSFRTADPGEIAMRTPEGFSIGTDSPGMNTAGSDADYPRPDIAVEAPPRRRRISDTHAI